MDRQLQRFIAPWPIHVVAGDRLIWNQHSHLRPEVYGWLEENVAGEWDYDDIYCVVCFDRDADAVSFKMRWG